MQRGRVRRRLLLAPRPVQLRVLSVPRCHPSPRSAAQAARGREACGRTDGALHRVELGLVLTLQLPPRADVPGVQLRQGLLQRVLPGNAALSLAEAVLLGRCRCRCRCGGGPCTSAYWREAASAVRWPPTASTSSARWPATSAAKADFSFAWLQTWPGPDHHDRPPLCADVPQREGGAGVARVAGALSRRGQAPRALAGPWPASRPRAPRPAARAARRARAPAPATVRARLGCR